MKTRKKKCEKNLLQWWTYISVVSFDRSNNHALFLRAECSPFPPSDLLVEATCDTLKEHALDSCDVYIHCC